jgi:4-hydroxymandelate oxidase
MTLPAAVVAYIKDGAASGETTAENRRALDRWRLMPRVLVDVSSVSTVTRLLGAEVAAPLVIAPMAAQRLLHPDGELAVARAAARVGIPMVLSLSSTVPVEQVGEVPGLDFWFQLYPFADSEANQQIIGRAIAAGARAIVVTVDMPPPGRIPALGSTVTLPPGVSYAHHGAAPPMSSDFDWSDLADLVSSSVVPVMVKGVLHTADVRRAVEHGAAAVVISNHGGRVHDGMVGAIDALAEVDVITARDPALASTRPDLLLDGGIDSGADVVRAIALGASAVMLGRTVLWALADGGQDGVLVELERHLSSLERTMAVIGAPTVAAITRDHVRRVG